MILIIDNYDSFTYNLVQLVGLHTKDFQVVRNDKISIGEIERMNPERILISPGPGLPENTGICVELIRTVGKEIPILGVCLGHQAIGYAFGGKIIHAPKLMHGKTSRVDPGNDKATVIALREIAEGFTDFDAPLENEHDGPARLMLATKIIETTETIALDTPPHDAPTHQA